MLTFYLSYSVSTSNTVLMLVKNEFRLQKKMDVFLVNVWFFAILLLTNVKLC